MAGTGRFGRQPRTCPLGSRHGAWPVKKEGHRNLCALLFQRGLPPVEGFSSPRAWAFALLAIQKYLRAFSGDRRVNQLREVLTNHLVDLFRKNSSDDWVWFEPVVAYDNAKTFPGDDSQRVLDFPR